MKQIANEGQGFQHAQLPAQSFAEANNGQLVADAIMAVVAAIQSATEAAWSSWVPTFTNLSGGTLNYAKFKQVGKTVHYRIGYTLGGAGVAGSVTFSLPVAASTSYLDGSPIGRIRFQDTGTGNSYGIVQYVSATANGLMVIEVASGTYLSGTVLSSTAPHTWANTDTISITGSYEAA